MKIARIHRLKSSILSSRCSSSLIITAVSRIRQLKEKTTRSGTRTILTESSANRMRICSEHYL